jgi:hypothetical protein
MNWLSHPAQPADEADLERLRELYAALGPGFPAEVVRVFADEETSADGGWCLSYNGRRERCLPTTELSNHELFAMPPTWELIGVTVSRLSGRLTKRGEQLDAAGHLFCRPRGAWETMRLPFLHHWTLCAGKLLRFESLLDGIELCRAEAAAFGVS